MNCRTPIAAVLVLHACAGAHPGSMPMPAVTPFEGSPVERAAYLEHYRAGYEAALTGYHSSWGYPRERDSVSVARSSGWCDGQHDGFGVWLEEMSIAVERRDRPRVLHLLSGHGAKAPSIADAFLAHDR